MAHAVGNAILLDDPYGRLAHPSIEMRYSRPPLAPWIHRRTVTRRNRHRGDYARVIYVLCIILQVVMYIAILFGIGVIFKSFSQ